MNNGANMRVRTALKAYKVKRYELAAALGIRHDTLSRKLRTELPEAQQARMIEAAMLIARKGNA